MGELYKDGKKAGPRLRELAPAARGGVDVGYRNLMPTFVTTPRPVLLAHWNCSHQLQHRNTPQPCWPPTVALFHIPWLIATPSIHHQPFLLRSYRRHRHFSQCRPLRRILLRRGNYAACA